MFASEIRLGLVAFNDCLSSRRYKPGCAEDIEDRVKAGVTGTLTFFINGRPIAGAQPLQRSWRLSKKSLRSHARVIFN
jgi:protein-disulfide isomerase